MPAVLTGALMGAVDRFRSNPVAQARKWLQNILVLIFAAWLAMSLYGRRLGAEGEPEAAREFDVSEWVDEKVGESLGGSGGAQDGTSGGSGASGGGGTPAQNQALGQQMAASAGWTGQQWLCLKELWQRESGWDHRAENPSSGAYGIPQRYPGIHGKITEDWKRSPKKQISWGISYIRGRYGDPCRALAFHNANNWY